jgi:hypothetical protein
MIQYEPRMPFRIGEGRDEVYGPVIEDADGHTVLSIGNWRWDDAYTGKFTQRVVDALNRVPLPAPDNNAVVEFLAERMHIAWMRQKHAQGFADHPYTRTDHEWLEEDGRFIRIWSQPCCAIPQARHHPAMVSYVDLDESAKDIDRAGARELLRALAEYMEAIELGGK